MKLSARLTCSSECRSCSMCSPLWHWPCIEWPSLQCPDEPGFCQHWHALKCCQGSWTSTNHGTRSPFLVVPAGFLVCSCAQIFSRGWCMSNVLCNIKGLKNKKNKVRSGMVGRMTGSLCQVKVDSLHALEAAGICSRHVCTPLTEMSILV